MHFSDHFHFFHHFQKTWHIIDEWNQKPFNIKLHKENEGVNSDPKASLLQKELLIIQLSQANNDLIFRYDYMNLI